MKAEALVTSPYAKARNHMKEFLQQGNALRPGEMRRTTPTEDLPPLTRRREGSSGPFEDLEDGILWSPIECRDHPQGERQRQGKG